MTDPKTWTVAPTLGVRDVLATVEYFRQVLGFEVAEHSIYGGVGAEGAVYAIARRGGAEVN